MGNILFTNLKLHNGYEAVYRVEQRDTEVMKKIWQIVDVDLTYYGSAFCRVLFQNHPQYIKYFEDETLPEFVQEAKVKKKFASVCNVLSTLFINYYNKPLHREYLLGYIAMVHKDMGLSAQDIENFVLNLLEMLLLELPDIMTAECTLVQIKYFRGLINRVCNLMEEHRQKMTQYISVMQEKSTQHICKWFHRRHLIYGHPIEYWLAKKRYWDYRRAVWSSMEMDEQTVPSSASEKPALTIPKPYNRAESYSSQRLAADVKRPGTHQRYSEMSKELSESEIDRLMELHLSRTSGSPFTEQEKPKKEKKRYFRRHSKYPPSGKVTPDVDKCKIKKSRAVNLTALYQQQQNQRASALSGSSKARSRQHSQAFLDAVRILRALRSSSESSTQHEKREVRRESTARERKRQRDSVREENADQESLRKSNKADAGTSITNRHL